MYSLSIFKDFNISYDNDIYAVKYHPSVDAAMFSGGYEKKKQFGKYLRKPSPNLNAIESYYEK